MTAISAISRGVQVVVAGDTQQLAPTSFFQRTSAGEDTAHTGESVLDVLAGLLPVRHLRWHYRSLDERLIAFSNEAVYEGELITFPRADVENVLRLHRVEVREPYPDEAAPDQGKAEVEDAHTKAARIAQQLIDQTVLLEQLSEEARHDVDLARQLLADEPSADHQKLADDTFDRHVMAYSQWEMSWKNSQEAIKEADKFNIPVSGIPLPS